eukprot:gene14379-19286_t
MIGCASHRLNLFIQAYLDTEPIIKSLLAKLDLLMTKLRTLKNTFHLRNSAISGNVVAIKRQATRWSSAFKMIERYLKIKPSIDSNVVKLTREEKLECVPTNLEHVEIVELNKSLIPAVASRAGGEVIKSVDQDQDKHMNCALARTLFEKLIEKHPNMKANLVHKDRDGQQDMLTVEEKEAVSVFELHRNNGVVPIEISSDDEDPNMFAKNIVDTFGEQQKRRKINDRLYIDISFVVPTSNRVERLFSRAKLYLTDHRKSMLPKHLELLLYLRSNRSMWNVYTVNEAVNMKDEVQVLELDALEELLDGLVLAGEEEY